MSTKSKMDLQVLPFKPVILALFCIMLILLSSLASHLLFLFSDGRSIVAIEAGIYVAVGAWLGIYGIFVIYIAAVLSNILILNNPIELALAKSMFLPLESIGIMLLIRTNLVDSSLEKIEDWALFSAVQFLVVVPTALLFVETTAYLGYWPHVWEALGRALLFRFIVSHLSGGILLGGLLIMSLTNFLRNNGFYIEHFVA